MPKSKEQIIQEMIAEMPFTLATNNIPYILEAMQIYADQESIKYATWLNNQVIAGRTAAKLWIDYKDSVLS